MVNTLTLEITVNANQVQIDGVRISTSSSSSSSVVGAPDQRRGSSASECSVEVDLEAGARGTEVHVEECERDCRICHLSMDAEDRGSFELGCSCKEDLAVAHKHCAVAWFKIKGDKTCEICGSTACNVSGANETESMGLWREPHEVVWATAVPPMHSSGARNFCQSQWFLNFVFACMVFAFVVPWFIHLNIPS